MEKEFLKSSYQQHKVAGRDIYCPRVGVYKPLRINSKHYCGKRQMVMKAFWKPSLRDSYQPDFVVEVLLEPFMERVKDADYLLMNEYGLMDKEIIVHAVSNRARGNDIEFEIRKTKLYKTYIKKMYDLGNMAITELIIKQISNRNEK